MRSPPRYVGRSLREILTAGMVCILAAVLITGGGCASMHYKQTQAGKLHGRLLVEWIGQDRFILRPDPDPAKRLTFTRANGDVITPGEMYTDGGSIPRPLWVFRALSPWGYAPAYIIHDWLFDAHHCGDLAFKYDVNDAATIMSEVMKTMMVDTGAKDELTMYATYVAVRSGIARDLWDHGQCNRPDLEAAKKEVAQRKANMDFALLMGTHTDEVPTVQAVVEWPPRAK